MCEHRLELSTGVVVGFCYHKAADLRVRQAAHSLPCLSLVFGLALRCCLQQLFARDHRSAILTALHGVWSLTGHELLRWERPRRLCGSRAVLFVFLDSFFGSDSRLSRKISRTGSGFGRISRLLRSACFTICATCTAHFRGRGAQHSPTRLACCNALKSA